jgi:cyclopropane-fatty-acyl-phospholipid synthase
VFFLSSSSSFFSLITWVVTVVSKEQLAYARESCRGLNVEFVEDDYRNAAQSGQFDRVYSIGFFEAVGRHNYRNYFEVVDTCLKDDGLHLVHSITLRDASLPNTDDWLNKYIFPGGELPHPQDYFTYSEGLLAVEDVHNLGLSYAKTLRVWKKNFIEHWPKTLEQKYGSLVDGRFYRMWINYLEGSIGSFEGRACHLYQVVHSKQGSKAGAPCTGYESVR